VRRTWSKHPCPPATTPTRQPPLLQESSRALRSPNRVLAALFFTPICEGCTVLQKSEAHPLIVLSFTHSLQKHRGCHPERFFNSPTLPSSTVTPLDATLTADLRVGFQGLYLQTLTEQPTEISRNRPPASPLDATLTDFAPVTPLSATLTKNAGGWVTSCS